VSAALNHRVDELLVDIVTAVRRHRHAAASTDVPPTGDAAAAPLPAAAAATSCLHDPPADTSCVRSAAVMLKGLFTKHHKPPPASKSCDNLID